MFVVVLQVLSLYCTVHLCCMLAAIQRPFAVYLNKSKLLFKPFTTTTFAKRAFSSFLMLCTGSVELTTDNYSQ